MSRPFVEQLPHIAARLAAAPHVALLLDYDGTLTPIVDRPENAFLAPEVRTTLERLAAVDRVTLAIVSGRSLDHVRQRVNVAGAVYAGNHGLEIASDQFRFVHPVAAQRSEALRSICEGLSSRVADIAGAFVEDKGLSASVHFRLTPPDLRPRVLHEVEQSIAGHSSLFTLRGGKMVWEIRPSVAWDKGEAVKWIIGRLGLDEALPVYIGDDLTDEDAFRALRGGITVRVGHWPQTCAEYDVPEASDVPGLLDRLADMLSSRPPRSLEP